MDTRKPVFRKCDVLGLRAMSHFVVRFNILTYFCSVVLGDLTNHGLRQTCLYPREIIMSGT